MARSRGFRGLAVLFGLLLLFVGIPAALAQIGDVDDDGDVDATDVQMVLEAVIGIRILSPAEQEAADVDGDGKVMVLDAQIMQQVVSGALPGFPPRLPQRSSPIALTRDGALLGVVNPDSDTVSFVDVATDTVLAEVAVGREPTAVAFSRSGDKAYVTNARDAEVSIVDTFSLTVTGSIGVGVEPFGVVVNFRGDRAYVSNMASGTVTEIDTETDTVLGEAAVGFQPQGLAVTRDSDRVYVTHLKGGEVSVIDAETLAVTSIPLAEIPFDELNTTLPAGVTNRMKGIAIHPTLDEAWLPHILSNSGNFVETLFNTSIFPAVGVIDTANDSEIAADRMTLFSGISTVVSSPEAVAFSPDGNKAYVVCAASDDLIIFDTVSRQEVGLVRDVGDNPRGIVVSPDGLEAYVFNRLTPEVSIVDLVTETLTGSVPVSTDPLPANLANGRRLFFTSAPPEVAQDRFFGCEACHFDGRDDGQTWFFTNGPRQTLSMAGGTNDPSRHSTGLLHTNGDRENVQDFRFTFTRLQNGTGLSEDQLDDLADFVNQGIRFLENPFLNPDLSRTDAARRGRRVFEKAECSSCHSFPFFTDAQADLSNPVLHDVGIFAEGTGSQDASDKTRDQDGVAGGTVRPAGSFESTFLLGVWATPPFLHDGRSPTLLDTLTTDNPTDAHGVTSTLTAQELSDLVAYLQQLDITNSRIRVTFPADGARVVDLTEVRGEVLPGVSNVEVFVDGAGPIAAVVNDSTLTFTAAVPGGLVPALGVGELFDISAFGNSEPGRDDIEVEVNFGAGADPATSTVEASPALITADGVSTSTITITPRDGFGDPVGTGLSIEAQASQGSLGPVVDMGDGSYQALLTSITAAVSSTVTANEQGGAVFSDTAVVTFAAGDVDPATSSVNVSPTSLEADGIMTATVTVVPRDAFGNDLGPGQAVGVAVDLGNVAAAVDQLDGTYTATFTAGTTTGTATFTATVNAVELNPMPTVTLVTDVTPPGAADLDEIDFATPVAGISQVAGGAGSAEPFAQVTATNSDTLATSTVSASSDGSFALSIAVAANEEVCFDIEDLAGNPGAQICLVPFPVPFESVEGVVQTPTGPGSYAPVAGVLVELVSMDLADPCNPVFLGLGTTLATTTAGDGSFEIVLPNGFVADLDLDPDQIALAVISGPDVAPADGRVDDPPDRYTLVSDLDRTVLVDEFTTELPFLICDDVCGLADPDPPPASFFSPDENVAIESTVREATNELDFSGLAFGDISFAVEDDVFFDLDGPKDALDQIAFDTFCEAASTAGSGVLPTVISGDVIVPSSGGDVTLPGVLVDLATIEIDPLTATSIRTSTTDGSGQYTVGLSGVPPYGVVAVGTLSYDGAGNPGAFSGSGSSFSLGTLVTDPDDPQDVDVAGRAVMNLIEIPAVPIANFNPTELQQLTDLCRAKVAAAIGGAVPLANRTLAQVFGDAFAVCAADLEVQQLLAAIADPEGDGCNLSATPTTAEADGHTEIEITVEPVDEFAQRVGAGLNVDVVTDLGIIQSPAIDERDGLYTTFLRAPTTAGTATVEATVEGSGCPAPLEVIFTADTTAPPSPDASRILFSAIGGGTVTVLGLPGAAEPFSQVTVENLSQATSVTVGVAADGSFRAILVGMAGDNLAVRSADAAANTSGDTGVAVGAATSFPTLTNPGDAPGAVTLTPLALGSFGAAMPPGYTFLRGFDVAIAGGGNATAPLEVVARTALAVPPGSDLLLLQEIDVAGTPSLRPVAGAGRRSSILFPLNSDFPGIIEPGRYAYVAADQPQAFLSGTVSGTRGPILDAEVTADVSPFTDLSRSDGSYLLAAAASQTATVGAAVVTHDAPVETDPVGLPFGGAMVQCDVDLPTRADRSFAFTGRFLGVGGTTERLAVLPSDEQLYVALTNAGDIEIIDTDTLTQASFADDAQSIQDLVFTPNGFEAFIAYFSRMRDFTVSIEEPGLLISTVGFPRAVTVPPNGNAALVASSLDNSSADSDPDAVFVLDTFTNALEAGSIPVDADPAAISTNSDGSRAYTVSETQGTLTVIDLPNRTVLATVPAGTQPVDVVADTTELYVADAAAGEVLVIDAVLADDGVPGNELLAAIPVGGAPSALALTPDGATLLVTEQLDDTLSVIDVASRTVTDVWAVTDLPPDVAVSRDGTRAWVLDRQTDPGVLEIVLADSDGTAPAVVDVGPEDRPDDLLQDSPIEIVFSERMNPATLSDVHITVLDEFASPIPGSVSPENGGVSAVFTPDPGTRYLLNSQVTVEVGTGVSDAAGNPLPSLVSRVVPTIGMQLPNLTLISVDLTTSGIEVNGQAGAVEPKSEVTVTNLLTLEVFSTTAASDGSFALLVEGLDTDGYELVTSRFGGRAVTDPVPLPVSFTIVLPDPLLISYQAGPGGTLEAAGAPGAVDPQSSEVEIRNLTSGQSFSTSTIAGDGSFTVGIFAEQGDALELVSTILGAIELDPVPLPTPNLPAPVIEFLTPDRFTQGDPVTLTVVGTDFGSVAANVLLRVDGAVRNDFLLDTLDEDPTRDAIVVDLAAGADSGEVTVTVAGQTSNAEPYFAELAPNTSPFAEEVISSNTTGDPNNVLNASDSSFTELGEGGDITVRLGSTVEDGTGNDFQVFEDTSDGQDCYEVLVSASSMGPFDSLGQFCGTAFVNLSGHAPIRFVKIVDAADGGNSAKIGSLLAIRVPLSLSISFDGGGGGGGGGSLSSNVSASIQESDTHVCPEETKGFSVSVSPAPTGGGGYGGGCTDTITWAVSGGGMVMPTNGASTTYTAPMNGGTTSTVTVTVTRTGNCSSTGTDTKTVKVDVIKVETVQWVAKDSPLSANAHPKGAPLAVGQRMFPDKTSASDSVNRKIVKVQATVKPVKSDVEVHFKRFDVDDPETDNTIDPNGVMGGDNLGSNAAGSLSSSSDKTDGSGIAEVEFTTSMQPGNNFRVAAACKAADLNPLTNDNVPPDPANDAMSAAVNAFKPDKGNLTDLLTIWRRLWMEFDTMPAIDPAEAEPTGFATDFTSASSSSSSVTRVDTDVTLGDGGMDLDDGAMTPGRFENGTVELGTVSPVKTINPITGNGNNHATFPAESLGVFVFFAQDDDIIPIPPPATMSGLVTEITKSGANFVYHLGSITSNEDPIDWPDFVGGTITLEGGVSVPITATNAANMTVTSNQLRIPFKAKDDDPNNLPFATGAIHPIFMLAYRDVYIEPMKAASGHNTIADFQQNIVPGDLNTIEEAAGDSDRANDYWLGYSIWVHQFHDDQDYDFNMESTAGRGSGRGWCTGNDKYSGTAIETSRDSYTNGRFSAQYPGFGYANFQALVWRTAAHEIGHEFGLGHTMPPNNTLMSFAEAPPAKSQRFGPTDMRMIRMKATSPGR